MIEQPKANNVGFARTLRYNFDNSLSRPGAFIGYVFIAIIILAIAMTLVQATIGAISALNQPLDSGTHLFAFWDAFTKILGFGSTDPWGTQIVQVLYWAIGIAISGAVIGFISNMITRTVAQLKLGKGPVIESGHTLILGWSNLVFPILKELAIANANVRKPKVVIFSTLSRDAMEGDIESRAGAMGKLKVITRTGDPTNPADLQRVNVFGAKSIIILDADASGDAKVVSTVLAIKAVTVNPDIHIVAELDDPNIGKALSSATNGQVIAIRSHDVIARVTAQASRQPGLATVVLDLLDFDGDEIYFADAGALVGRTYSDAILAFNTASVIGVVDAQGRSHVNPSPSYQFQNGDKVIAIAADDDKVVFTGFRGDVATRTDTAARKAIREPEHLLVIGWSTMGHSVLKEVSAFLPMGSTVHIVAQSKFVAPSQLSQLDFGANVLVTFASVSHNLSELTAAASAKKYNEILILGYRNSMSQTEADAQTMLTMLQMNQLFAAQESGVEPTRLVAEILDSRKAELARVAGTDDLVVSDNLAALLIAQVAENPALAGIFEDLFDADGASVNIRPIQHYAPLGKDIEFAQLVGIGRSYGESVIGYRVHADAKSSASEAVKLNPSKTRMFTPATGDGIIVIGNVE
ncbi:MAG: hypothetical protein EXS01_05030 [Phycisphaerales bacterium]|nr:hypothetical protein [Phycisphaerales bacterium]